MQAATDIFLGWATSQGIDYYVRQLREMKGTINVATLDARSFADYVELCGWTLARAHARRIPAARLAGYLGSGTAFDEAMADFAVTYARQVEADHALLVEAVRSGRNEAQTGV